MKRVLQILYSGLGGHGSVAFSLAAAARTARAWENHFLFVGIEPVLPEYAQHCLERGYSFAGVRTLRGAPWLTWPAVYRGVRRARPDAIVLHSVKTIAPNHWYARRRGVPLIAVEHQANDLKTRAEWWASGQLMRKADAVVVLTAEYLEALQAHLGAGFDPSRVRVIPNGIDTDRFAPTDRLEGHAELHVGMAARMTSTKRQDLLIDALAMAVAEGLPWRLHLAGDGPCIDALRARAARLGVAGQVEFSGFLDEQALREWFARLDVYAHASDGETLSTSLLQAMACGLPIVGSDVAGIANLLDQDEGVGVAVGQSAQAFVAAIRGLAERREAATALAARARRAALARYSQTAMFENYRQVLEAAWQR